MNNKMIKKVPSTNYRNKTTTLVDEEIIVDETVKITINNSLTRSFTISPNNIKEFTAGYLLGEGLITNTNQITNMDITDNQVTVEIDLEDFDIRKELVAGSDCFGGWRHKIDYINPVDSDYQIDSQTIFEYMSKLKENAEVWNRTGGCHIAGLVNSDKFLSFEDVSRHVALDKLIGAAALENINFKESFIVYSGRMPADMMIKVSRVGIPIVASNAAPTLSGYEIAQEANITMLGFVRDERYNIYTHSERIIE